MQSPAGPLHTLHLHQRWLFHLLTHPSLSQTSQVPTLLHRWYRWDEPQHIYLRKMGACTMCLQKPQFTMAHARWTVTCLRQPQMTTNITTRWPAIGCHNTLEFSRWKGSWQMCWIWTTTSRACDNHSWPHAPQPGDLPEVITIFTVYLPWH